MSQRSAGSVEEFVNEIAPVNARGQVVCRHRLPAKRLTSHTPANPEREFYTCSKNSDDPDRCKFFAWADDPTLCSVLESKRKTMEASTPATPQRPSQAQRALFSRTPTLAATSMKRQRSPSPTPSPASAYPGLSKYQRVGSVTSDGAGTGSPASASVPSRRAGGTQAGESASQEEKRKARLKIMQDAILSVHATPRDSSPASLSGSLPPDSINKPSPRLFPGSTQATQSDVGTSIDTEVELAEMEEMESRAVQTSPIDDEGSSFEGVWRSTPPLRPLGSPAPTADVGASPYVGHSERPLEMPHLGSGAESRGWSPAPPHTPGRGGSSRIFAHGGNSGESHPSMLLTPPGSSQPHHGSAAGAGPSTTQRGRGLLQEMLASPTAAKGKGLERSEPVGARQHWQMVQDDPENPFRSSSVARGAASPAPTAISVADGVGGDPPAGALSADSIASHLAALQDIPEYIAKLERREKAARKSAEIKGRKIAQLEEEVQRLRNEKRALEETVAALQMRR
ncbi:hypothetical protein C8Q77DRAFT_253363 [Trametes polyzona]|nr:hypothetical protein C8Q77DRAFT_253363 [Trametes polyzona]